MKRSRDTKRGAHKERTSRLHRLFYQTFEGEQTTVRGKATSADVAARTVMADALQEMGSFKTADQLRRLGPGKLSGTLLQECIRRTIFGPSARREYTPRKPLKKVLLAQYNASAALSWIRLDPKRDVWGTNDDGNPYIFEIGRAWKLYEDYKAASRQEPDAPEEKRFRTPQGEI
jgi:hypothetical protein